MASSDDEAMEHTGRAAANHVPVTGQQPAVTSNSNSSRHGSTPGSHGASPLGQHLPPRVPPGTVQSGQPLAGRSVPTGGASGHGEAAGAPPPQNPPAATASNGKVPHQPIKTVRARQKLHPCHRCSLSYTTRVNAVSTWFAVTNAKHAYPNLLSHLIRFTGARGYLGRTTRACGGCCQHADYTHCLRPAAHALLP